MTTWLVDARTLSTRPTGIGVYAYRLLKRRMAEEPGARFVLASDVAESAELREPERLGCEIRTYGRRVFKSDEARAGMLAEAIAEAARAEGGARA